MRLNTIEPICITKERAEMLILDANWCLKERAYVRNR